MAPTLTTKLLMQIGGCNTTKHSRQNKKQEKLLNENTRIAKKMMETMNIGGTESKL